ncbi:MAG: bifunctional diguanylate cyclase/phosphodiesterase [Coprobacillus sp.]
MKTKNNIIIYTSIWIVAILILTFSLTQNVGDAKVINYSGIIRGATQKLIKKELHGKADDKLIVYLDDILYDLQTGNGEYGLVLFDDSLYQSQLEEMNGIWTNIKEEIYKVRDGHSNEELFNLSEDYFVKANTMVETAQEVSDKKTRDSLSVFVGYLIVTIGVFIFWYKYKQKQINKAMYIDKLTGIHNFAAFEKEAEVRIEKIDQQRYAFICLDIDRFKYLNSTYGSQIGDQLLKTIAATLQVYAGHDGCCARYGSDEFFLFCEYNEFLIDKLKLSFKENMKESIELDIYNDLTVTCGVYLIQKDESIKDMLDNVSLAHKQAKKMEKGSVLYYNQNLLNDLYYESRLTKEMYPALEHNEFKLYLQPKFDIPSLKIVGAEALVRWHNRDNKILYPDEFIPLFEQNGFIYNLDFYMLEQVCLFIKKNHLEDTHFSISVNLSRVTIHHQDFKENLKLLINKYKIPICCIELEITESSFNEFPHHIISMLNQLSEEGFVFSMDDFGAGYSSLNSIHKIPVDIIKIDRKFVTESRESPNVIQIIRLIIETAHLLNKLVVCEGVEELQDVHMLNKLDCHIGQGYYVSKPIYHTEFLEKYL